MMHKASRAGLLIMLAIASLSAESATAYAAPKKVQMSLESWYKQCADEYDMSWALLAAIDRYAELTKTKQQKALAPYYGFPIDSHAWSGLANPNEEDVNPETIQLFGGLGIDANHDGLAVPWDEYDRIASLAAWLDAESGEEEPDGAIWSLEQDATAMDRIYSFAQIFDKFGLYPTGNCFPIAKRYNYTVKHTFGAGRSWGGRRIHEGVDIFAGYGTPVLACTYGYVELIGWNRYGGWRIGIRDTNNMYYYYAHLSSFSKGLKQGDIVQPGQVIGYVGSTGYGPPGTSGKFPPHLHFGIYRDTGRSEWAFSPSGMLSSWQRMPQKIIYPEAEKNKKR
jgi:peptidoglycan LD-endopeptidase LytH